MSRQSFSAALRESGRGGGRWVQVPFDAREVFGEARPAVRGTVNGTPLRSRLSVYGGTTYLGLRREIREAAGIEVGAHSHPHPHLDLLSTAGAAEEIGRSKGLLEDGLGHEVWSFAYPHGYASRRTCDEVRRRGFRSACGVRNAFSHPGDNRWLMARLTVRATTTCDEVAAWLDGTGAPDATAGEHLQTKAWRAARRVGRPFSQRNHRA